MGDRPTVALAVSGSIAAYKAPIVARLLLEAGARVRPLMTAGAARFLGAPALAGVCGEPVLSDMWDPSFPGEMHVDVAREIDLLVIAPATADLVARLATGRADDVVTAVALCARCPVLVAPAMHESMWTHPATRRNVATLAADGRVRIVGPVEGPLASGERGMGRMADPADIAAAAMRLLTAPDLRGLRIAVTAGPTVEDLDAVRFLGNRSSGRMGFAIASRAAARGADVTLVAGPSDLATPSGARRVDVRSAMQMRDALRGAAGADLGGVDAIVMAAAVGDYRPEERREGKIEKTGAPLVLRLVENPDLIGEIGAARRGPSPVLVAFAVEAGEEAAMVARARRKLETKRVDLVVANPADVAFGGTHDRAALVGPSVDEWLPPMPKTDLADIVLDRVRELCAAASGVASRRRGA